MKEECKLGSFGVGAVVGLTERETDDMLAGETFVSVCRTNTNNDTCCIFSGASTDLNAFLAAAGKRGALSTVRLGLSIPYHHPAYLAKASQRLFDIAGKLPWRNAETPIVSSIDQAMLFRAHDLVRFVAANIASPVNWRKVSETLAAQGMTTAYECGPGISLSQNGRFIDNPMRYVTVKKLVRSSER
jgi:[acyl-carrier-protein] S-malonyltransferase